MAELRCDGLTAPWNSDRPIAKDIIIEIYVEIQLALTLDPGDVVILDNLPSHKSEKTSNSAAPDSNSSDLTAPT